MTTLNLIEGLTILNKYRDGYNVGADHDVIYFYSTDKPIQEKDLLRLFDLGWQQIDLDPKISCYDPEEGWCYFV